MDDRDTGGGGKGGGGKGGGGKRGGATVRPGETCPICGSPTVHRYRPFCSSRCANIDLNRWLTGQYAIPVVEDEDEDGGIPTSEGPAGEA